MVAGASPPASTAGAIAAARARLGAAAVVGGAGGEAALSAMPDFGVGDAEATAALSAAKQGASDAPDAFLSAAETLTAALGSAADWGRDLASSYMVDVHELADLVAAAGGAVASLFDWNLVEVVRDFAQLVGLLFSTFLSLRKNPFGYLVTLANFDISYSVPSIDMGTITMLLVVCGFIAILAFICINMKIAATHQPDAIRDGLEMKSWEERRREGRDVLMLEYVMFALTSLYLPLSQAAVEILACTDRFARAVSDSAACTPPHEDDYYKEDDDDDGECDCGSPGSYAVFIAMAVGILVFITVGVPLRCYLLIEKAVPFGSIEDKTHRYNDDGALVEYDRKMYAADLKLAKWKANPFHFLYKSYERDWRQYKVIVMVVKITVALPCVLLVNLPAAQAGACLVLLLAFAALSWKASPFLEDTANRLDRCGRVTVAATAALGLLAVVTKTRSIASVLVTIVNVLNGLLMGAIVLASTNAYKKLFRAVTFSNRVEDEEGPADRIVPTWDIPKEIRRRLWQDFWEGLIMKNYENVGPRLLELKEIGYEKGIKRVESHFAHAAEPAFRQVQHALLNHLEGVDVFYDRPPADGHLGSKMRMGKMYINPFPFHAVMVYDDSSDHTFIHDVGDLQYLATSNLVTDAVGFAKRQLREHIRAFHCSGELVRHHHECDRIFHVPDGTHEETDHRGETRTVQDYSDITVHLTFHEGQMHIRSEDDKNLWSAGFDPWLFYCDGHGQARKPRTGEMFHVTNERVTLGSGELGFDQGDYTLTAGTRLAQMVAENGGLLQRGTAKRRAVVANYRSTLNAKRAAKEATLSSAFWLFIYMNDTATRPQVERFFASCESRGPLAGLPSEHRAGLDFAYGRLAFARSGPCAAFWCIFWHDLWACNKSLPPFEAAAEMLDPMRPASVAYRPMPRPQLEQALGAKGLWKPKPSREWVHAGVLDVLYDGVRAAGAGGQPPPGGGGAPPTPAPPLPTSWTCDRCTLVNAPGTTVCQACDAEPPVSV